MSSRVWAAKRSFIRREIEKNKMQTEAKVGWGVSAKKWVHINIDYSKHSKHIIFGFPAIDNTFPHAHTPSRATWSFWYVWKAHNFILLSILCAWVRAQQILATATVHSQPQMQIYCHQSQINFNIWMKACKKAEGKKIINLDSYASWELEKMWRMAPIDSRCPNELSLW